ncbi:MAG: putative transporter permease protein [Dehalococcoidia bacterium]|nr:putative transporter permease protein [Dehalococcoidia bacterium]
MTLVFTIVFTVLLPNNQIQHFPVFILIGILAWNLHSTSMGGAINSVVGNGHLVQKVYFPREVLPISVVLSNTVNFLLALAVLLVAIPIFGVSLSATILILPLVIFIQVVFTMGISLFLAAINVYYRDTGIIMDTVIWAWFFLTPIFYRIEDVFPAYSRALYILNPMASLIASYRDILYYGSMTNIDFFFRTAVTSFLILVAGYMFFTRHSRSFAEAI